MMRTDMNDLCTELNRDGFLVLGGFGFGPDDDAGSLLSGTAHDGATGTLILVGNAGGAMWETFSRSPEACDGTPDPLDRYTRRCITAVARRFALAAVFPFERPFRPFQRWAMRAGGFSPSPMGVLAHHRFGPWAGFRAALVGAMPLAACAPDASGETPDEAYALHGKGAGPCPTCVEKPCVAACPAQALSPEGYDVPRCLSHLDANPDTSCLSGCLARVACPHGTAYRQGAEQAQFHMRAFTGGNIGT